jgi:hypothetical protein
MRSVFCIVLIAVIAAPRPAAADNASAANFLTRLFMNACIPNAGQPENVRAWAAEKQLQEVTSQVALDAFVGPGGKGIAWAVPSPFGSFALSIRGTTQACAVWARAADPTIVENSFRTILVGASRPGVYVSVVRDARDAVPVGTVHTLIYSVTAPTRVRAAFYTRCKSRTDLAAPFRPR